jgi:hypothetical protein
LLGTDYPFPVFEPAPVQLLEATPLTAGEKTQIGEGTTRQLFGL